MNQWMYVHNYFVLNNIYIYNYHSPTSYRSMQIILTHRTDCELAKPKSLALVSALCLSHNQQSQKPMHICHVIYIGDPKQEQYLSEFTQRNFACMILAHIFFNRGFVLFQVMCAVYVFSFIFLYCHVWYFIFHTASPIAMD